MTTETDKDRAMAEAASRLRTAMLTEYGEEFRRKWAGFTPRELGALWSRRFSLAKIHPNAIDRLCNRITWSHPPSLPDIVSTLEALQVEMKREHDESTTLARLPAPSTVADPKSEAVTQFRAQFRQFAKKHFVEPGRTMEEA